MKTLQQEIVATLRELDLFTSISSSCTARDLSLKLMSLVEKIESARCENCEHVQNDMGICDVYISRVNNDDGCWHFKQKVK